MAVVGGQFGSEAKGAVVARIADEYDYHVRTGAPNAGHTYYVDGPEMPMGIAGYGMERVKVVARSVPVGAVNRNATLIIGAGALIDVDLLSQEVDELDRLGLDVSSRIVVDEAAMVVDPQRHHAFEGGVEGYAHELIGSTGEGVGPARMAKIARGTFAHPSPSWARIDQVKQFRDQLHNAGIPTGDTARLLNDVIDAGATVLLEGTQGSGLSLTHGPWPFVTSHDTNAATLAADAGIAPQLVSDVMLVFRTFPIRVAGNSGPLPGETSWEEIHQPEERTTVTKKVRRVAVWDLTSALRAVMLNRPTEAALMFIDYWNKDAAGVTTWDALPETVKYRVEDYEEDLGVPITMLGTGPDSIIANVETLVSHQSAKRWPLKEQAYGL